MPEQVSAAPTAAVPATPSPAAADAEATPATPPAALVETQRLAAELSDYKQREERSQLAATLENWVTKRAGQLKAAGWNEEAALDYATQQGTAALARFQGQQLAQENGVLLKYLAAQQIGAEFGVLASQLVQGNSPEEMRQLAKQAQAGNNKIKELEARLARFERGAVPAQQYDSGTGGGAMSDQEFEVYAANYDGPWPDAVRKRVQEIHARR